MFKRKQRGRRPAHRTRRRGNKTKINRSKLGLMPSVQNRNYATITESFRDPNLLSANTPYADQFNIGAFPRALLMARLFKFYRCTKIVYDYVPLSNTYQDAATGQNPTIPYFYYNMNRDGAAGGDNTLAQFLADGVRPIKFTKKIVIAYKPNLSQVINVADGGSPTSNTYTLGLTPVYDKWLSTDGLQDVGFVGSTEPVAAQSIAPNVVLQSIAAPPYYGHNFFIVQDDTGTGTTVGRTSVTCVWEFKEPVLNPRLS